MKTTRYFVTHLASLFLGMLMSCGPDPEPVFKYSYTVINESELALKLSCPSCEVVTLAIGETKTFETNTAFTGYTIEAAETTTKTIEYKETSANTFTITSYYWEVMYRFTGSAESIADVTFINGDGGTSTFINVPAGTNYQIKSFSGNTAQVSATRSQAGTIQLFIFHKDKIIKEEHKMNVTTLNISATLE